MLLFEVCGAGLHAALEVNSGMALGVGVGFAVLGGDAGLDVFRLISSRIRGSLHESESVAGEERACHGSCSENCDQWKVEHDEKYNSRKMFWLSRKISLVLPKFERRDNANLHTSKMLEFALLSPIACI